MLVIGLSNKTSRSFMRPSPLHNSYRLSSQCSPSYLNTKLYRPYSLHIIGQDNNVGEYLEVESEEDPLESDLDIIIGLDLEYDSGSVPLSSSLSSLLRFQPLQRWSSTYPT